MTTTLPPATPGTMQDAVPGIPSTPAPLPPQTIHPAPRIANKGSGHTPSSALAAIMNHARQPGGPLAAQPPKPEYKAVTQSDHSIAMHVVNPNGSLGPIVKIIPPLKGAGTSK